MWNGWDNGNHVDMTALHEVDTLAIQLPLSRYRFIHVGNFMDVSSGCFVK